jgi:hypothetical protein
VGSPAGGDEQRLAVHERRLHLLQVQLLLDVPPTPPLQLLLLLLL